MTKCVQETLTTPHTSMRQGRMRLGQNSGRSADEAAAVAHGHKSGGCEIRTREGLPPTRFPSLWVIVHARSARSVNWSCGLVRSSADALEPRRMRPELRPPWIPSLMVFKTISDLLSVPASTWAFSVAAVEVIQDHPAHIP
jgi:hypothetical protein